MHIPDGWLSIFVLLLAWSITAIFLAFSFSKIKNDFNKISNIGAIASVIFVAQMFNFPVAGGTTGHLLGGALAVYVVGFPGAILTMFSVLLVQAFVFADGGILALGANMLNMGITTIIVAYFIKNIKNSNTSKDVYYYVRVYLSAFFSVTIASIMASIELILSDKTTLSTGLPLILGYHIIIGFFEGVITVGIIYYLSVSNFPFEEYSVKEDRSFITVLKESNKTLIAFGGLLFSLSFLSLFAFSDPDGLESAGLQLFPNASSFYFQLGLANDYDFMGLGPILGTLLSAFLGILIIFGLYFIPASFITAKKQQT